MAQTGYFLAYKLLLRYGIFKPKAYCYGVVYTVHHIVVQVSHFFLKALFVYGAHLLQQYNRILCKAVLFGKNIYMGRQLAFIRSAGYCRRYYRGTELIPHIVLDNKYRSGSALFGAYNRTQIGVIYIPTLYTHVCSFLSLCCVFIVAVFCLFILMRINFEGRVLPP